MSNFVQPHRCQPTRLPHPWDSPGKNAGVGCHFLLQCMKVKSEGEVTQSYPTPHDPMDCSLPGSSIHEISRQEYWSGLPLPSPQKLNKEVTLGRWVTMAWILRTGFQGINTYVAQSIYKPRIWLNRQNEKTEVSSGEKSDKWPHCI